MLATKWHKAIYNIFSILWWGICLYLAIGTARAVRDKWTWECYRESLLANGERLTWRQLAPRQVADELNFAKTPLLEAIAYKERLNSNVWSRIDNRWPKSTNTGWGNFWEGRMTDLDTFRRALASETNSVLPEVRQTSGEIREVFRVWEPELNELRQASKRPYAQLQPEQPCYLRFSFDHFYNQGWSNVPHYAALRTLSQRCLVNGVAELSRGHSEEGFADAAVIFKLADCLKDSPALTSSMVRGAILNGTSVQLFWEGCVRGGWSDEHLRQFQNQFQSIDLIRQIDRAFRGGEWVSANVVADRSFFQLVPPFLWGRIFQLQMVHHRAVEDFILTSYNSRLGLISPRKTESNGAAYRHAARSIKGHKTVLAGLFFPDSVKVLRTVARNQTGIHLATLACALERHRKAKGQYPDKLEDLVPSFIQKVPHDVVNGQPFRYRRTDDGGFSLYSVGWDERDDGGVAAIQEDGKETGDWVWHAVARKSS